MFENQLYLKNVATLEYDEELCNGCRMCIEVCPHGVFAVAHAKAYITNKDRCMECGACALNCKTGAITVTKGVGCAAAVINSLRTGGEVSCDAGCGTTCC